MTIEVRVPTLGESVTEATVATWFKQPGDAVAADEMLCELETDKVTVEVPAPAAGKMAEIVAKEGETVGVDALLATISEGEGAGDDDAPKKSASDETSGKTEEKKPESGRGSGGSTGGSGGGRADGWGAEEPPGGGGRRERGGAKEAARLGRGSGGRGYAPPQTPAPRRIVICGLLPEEAPAPVTLTLCATRLSAQPALAGIKTLGRQDQLLARREWTDATVFDGLMRDAHDRVVETTFANIFIRRGGAIETPPIEATGIDGVMRHCLIELLAQDCPVRERPMTLADITAADGLCLTNSIRRLCPVGRLVGLDGGEVLARFDPHAFDDIARRLRQRVRDLTGY